MGSEGPANRVNMGQTALKLSKNQPPTPQSPPRHDAACSWCFDDNSQDPLAPAWKLANVRTTPSFKLPDRDSEHRNYREE